jgi:methyl-accepting chemotaxis protein
MNFFSKIKIRHQISLSAIVFFGILFLTRAYILPPSGIWENLPTLALILGFGYFISFFIVNDIKVLTSASEKVMSGDLNINIDLSRKGEFGQLGNSFNHMVSRIKSRMTSSDVLIEVMKKTALESDMEKILHILLEGAQKITNSQYAALAIFDKNKNVEKFIQIGMSQDSIRKIGQYPEGKGLLGYIHQTKTPLRLDDMNKHPHSVGFPAGHPPMKSLIAFPILFGEISLGNLYVSDKNTPEKSFNEDDEHAIKTFAQIAANIIREKLSEAEIIESKKYLENEIGNLLNVIDRLAAGDMTVTIEEHLKSDEIGKLKKQLRIMIQKLSGLISQVKDAVEATASATAEISSSTEEMSSGATEQSTQATEIAGAVEEMSKTILETSRNTSVAADNAKEAGAKAHEGGIIIEKTIQGMNKIADVVVSASVTVETLGKSSHQIGEIVEVINEIADQTNLLALNAAIEAARAGEQGRGFAVVADEVRKLADRTTQATNEIAKMIKQIQTDTANAVKSMNAGTNEVQNGKDLVNEAGHSLKEIISANEKVTDNIIQVATASEEQSRASDEISHSIEAITSITNETSIGISQIATATNDLSMLTTRLQDLVTQFKVREDINEHSSSLKQRQVSYN